MNRTHILIANMKDGSKKAFDFIQMKWTGLEFTDNHKCDGSRMCQIAAEVNALAKGLVITSMYWEKA